VIRGAAIHKRRTLFAATAALGGAIYYALTPADNSIFWIVVLGLTYRMVATPRSQRKGWLSVRGAVIAVAAFNILTLVTMASLGLIIIQSKVLELDEDTRESFNELLKYQHMSKHIYNVISGLIIALVLRYEWSVSEAAKGIPALEMEFPETEGEIKLEETATSPLSQLPTAPQFSCNVPRKLPSFSAPLFNLSLGALILVHIPAVLLSQPRYSSLYTEPSDEISINLRMVLAVLANMPPQLWGVVLIPVIVGFAAKIRGDGGALWRYSEEWIIMNKKETTEVQVGAVEAQKVDEKLVDVKA